MERPPATPPKAPARFAKAAGRAGSSLLPVVVHHSNSFSG
jgi:hypothetical protein